MTDELKPVMCACGRYYSECCGAPVTIDYRPVAFGAAVTGIPGDIEIPHLATLFYRCQKCGQPCDVKKEHADDRRTIAS